MSNPIAESIEILGMCFVVGVSLSWVGIPFGALTWYVLLDSTFMGIVIGAMAGMAVVIISPVILGAIAVSVLLFLDHVVDS